MLRRINRSGSGSLLQALVIDRNSEADREASIALSMGVVGLGFSLGTNAGGVFVLVSFKTALLVRVYHVCL
jgi:hypothetical protein